MVDFPISRRRGFRLYRPTLNGPCDSGRSYHSGNCMYRLAYIGASSYLLFHQAAYVFGMAAPYGARWNYLRSNGIGRASKATPVRYTYSPDMRTLLGAKGEFLAPFPPSPRQEGGRGNGSIPRHAHDRRICDTPAIFDHPCKSPTLIRHIGPFPASSQM